MLGLFDAYSASKSERALGLALSIIAIIFLNSFQNSMSLSRVQHLSLLYMPHQLHHNSFPTSETGDLDKKYLK